MAKIGLHAALPNTKTRTEINDLMVQETNIMKLRTFAVAAAALSLATAPVAAEIVSERSAPVAGVSELGGDGDANGVILALLAAAAVIGGILIAVGGDDDNSLSA